MRLTKLVIPEKVALQMINKALYDVDSASGNKNADNYYLIKPGAHFMLPMLLHLQHCNTINQHATQHLLPDFPITQ